MLRDCELSGGANCPIMADENVLSRMEEILADAYEVADGQGDYDPWLGSRPHLEWTAERDYQHEAEKQQELLRMQYDQELDEKERQLEAARNAADLSEYNRMKAQSEVAEYLDGFHSRKNQSIQRQKQYEEEQMVKKKQQQQQ